MNFSWNASRDSGRPVSASSVGWAVRARRSIFLTAAGTAAKEIRASGVNLTPNIAGFTLTNETVANELGALAGSTGGRYHAVRYGEALSRAAKLAAPKRLPCHMLDSSGKLLASVQISALSRELPPGQYHVRIEALGQKLEEPLTIILDQTTSIAPSVEGDRFVIPRQFMGAILATIPFVYNSAYRS